MHKVGEAMKSNKSHPMDGTVHIDEFVVGGREERKVVTPLNPKVRKLLRFSIKKRFSVN